jgi:hypothetical protein
MDNTSSSQFVFSASRDVCQNPFPHCSLFGEGKGGLSREGIRDMTDYAKVSELTAATSVADADLIEISQDAGGGSFVSRKVTAANSLNSKLPLAGGTLTGDLNISKAAPTLTFTSTDDSNNTATISRLVTSQELKSTNKVVTAATAGPAVNMSGVDGNYINTNQSSILNGLTAVTIAMWINPNSINTKEFTGNSNSGSVANKCYLRTGTGTDLQGGLYIGSTYADVRSASLIPSIGSWNLIVMRWTSGSSVRLNLNTTKYTGLSYSGSITDAGTWYIGTGSFASGRFHNGKADSVMIWNRDLSDAEITSLYNSGVGMYENTSIAPFNSGLIHGWRLNENTGTTTVDFVNSVNASFVGAGVTWTTGLVPNISGTATPTWASFKSSTLPFEEGILTLGNDGTQTNWGSKNIYGGLYHYWNILGVNKASMTGTAFTIGLPTGITGNSTVTGTFGVTGATTITGSADAIQLKVKANATQTTYPFQVVTSADANILSASSSGIVAPNITLSNATTYTGDVTATGSYLVLSINGTSYKLPLYI